MRLPVHGRSLRRPHHGLVGRLAHEGTPRAAREPGKEWFTPREAAAVLGIKPASVGVAVRRHRLQATGQGKARRFPLATVEALQDRLCQGASVETSNQDLTHLKALCRWLGKPRRPKRKAFSMRRQVSGRISRKGPEHLVGQSWKRSR